MGRVAQMEELGPKPECAGSIPAPPTPFSQTKEKSMKTDIVFATLSLLLILGYALVKQLLN